jgi:hypothetical protein
MFTYEFLMFSNVAGEGNGALEVILFFLKPKLINCDENWGTLMLLHVYTRVCVCVFKKYVLIVVIVVELGVGRDLDPYLTANVG